jgi:protein-tyrosine phosphatase
MNVLFVCSGNICRSPVAEACLRQRVSELGRNEPSADSAGTLGIEGRPICAEALRVLSELGIASPAHRSKGVRIEDVERADWIVAMERSHLTWLAQHARGGSARRALLRAFEHGPEPAPDPPDLEDPYGQPIEVYRDQIPLIVRCVDHLLAHLLTRP